MKDKNMKKIIASLLTVVIFLCGAYFIVNQIGEEIVKAYFSVFVFPDDFNKDKLPFSTHNYDELTDIEKQAYICIFNNISEHPDYIKIPSITSEEFNRVFFAVKNDNPDMLCFSDSCSMTTIGTTCYLQLTYDNDVEECNEKHSQLIKTVSFIIDEMPEFDDDYSKESYIHDYIVQNCEYRQDSASSTAYGCLIDGVAVCSGYSRAAMLLLIEAGIDSMVIAGNGYSETQGFVSHMWNIVWLDNEPYHLDVTWDDSEVDDEDLISYLYFNLTDEQISVDHSDYAFSGACDSKIHNYFVSNNLSFDSYNDNVLDTVKLRLLNNINNGRNFIDFVFDNDKAYQSALSNLLENADRHSDIHDVFDYLSKYASDRVDSTRVKISHDDNRRYIRMVFDNL